METNPFLLTEENRLIALDAKVNFDDNALFRHPEFKDLRDRTKKNRWRLKPLNSFSTTLSWDGNIACNGQRRGLAMATMDIIKLAGGASRQTFLTLGGGASQERG